MALRVVDGFFHRGCREGGGRSLGGSCYGCCGDGGFRNCCVVKCRSGSSSSGSSRGSSRGSRDSGRRTRVECVVVVSIIVIFDNGWNDENIIRGVMRSIGDVVVVGMKIIVKGIKTIIPWIEHFTSETYSSGTTGNHLTRVL